MNGGRGGDAQTAAPRWGIIGGGLLGLTLAWRLARAERKVVVFEAAPDVGGLAAAWRIGDVVWDKHYHVTLYSDLHLRGLLAELGLESDMRWVQTRTGFFHEGRIHSLSNLWEYATFPPLRLSEKIRLGATILHAARLRNGSSLESRTAEEWLTRWSGPGTVAKLWRPLLRAKLGDNASVVSARFIWATIARLYQARAAGMKSDRFGYLPGGYARTLARLVEQLDAYGVEVRTAHPVSRVEAVRGAGVRVTWAGGAAQTFDRVALTVPTPVAAAMCPQFTDDERRRCESVRYQGIICASLLLRRPLCGFYVLNLTDPDLPFTGVIEMSTLVDRKLLGGHHLIYLPRYVSQTDPLWEVDDASIRSHFVTGLRRISPDLRDDDIIDFRVSRVRHVFALPVLNYSGSLPPMQTSVPGVWLVTGAQVLDGTLNGNETVRLANASAPVLLRADENVDGCIRRPSGAAPDGPFDGAQDRLREGPGEDKASSARTDSPPISSPVPGRPEGWVRWWAETAHTDVAMQERYAQWAVRAVAPLLDFRAEDVVLDIGCGQGFVAAAVAGRVREYHGVDVSGAQLEHARLRLQGRGNVTFHELDPRAYTDLRTVSQRRFSLIVCNSVVQYYRDAADLEHLLHAVRQLALPGARMLITDLPGDTALASDAATVARSVARPREALRLLRATAGYLVGGYAATRWRSGLLRVRPDEIRRMLARLGLDGEVLSAPLTPLHGRSHVLVRFPGDEGAR